MVLVQKARSFKEVLNRAGAQAGGATALGNKVNSRKKHLSLFTTVATEMMLPGINVFS